MLTAATFSQTNALRPHAGVVPNKPESQLLVPFRGNHQKCVKSSVCLNSTRAGDVLGVKSHIHSIRDSRNFKIKNGSGL